MLTLSQATGETKTIFKIFATIIAVIVGFMILTRIVSIIKNIIIPPQPEKPTAAYGKLPKIIFPTGITNAKLTFSLNTISGSLPNFPTVVKVHRVSEPIPNLVSLTNTEAIVANAGFSSTPLKVDDRQYQWVLPVSLANSDFEKRMTMDIFSLNFDLDSAYLTNQSILSGANAPNQAQAVEIAQGFLDQMSLFPSDVDSTKTVSGLFSINSLNLVPATSVSTAQIVRVDFFQKDLDSLPIAYSTPFGSSMNFLVGGGSGQAQVVEAHFHHFGWSDNFATYPIKTSQELFSELVQGKAHIASFDGTSQNVTITSVYLAYYIDQNQKYFMPIAVFKGSNNFCAYLSAVNDLLVSN